MTILSCQKRHHEPHWVHDYLLPGMTAEWCDGLPQWPYQRPKPPRGIESAAHTEHLLDHDTVAVYRVKYATGLSGWQVYWLGPHHVGIDEFPTHAEAIAYAQGLVNERKKQSGLVQGG